MSAHVLLSGKLITDPVVRETKSGSLMANSAIAAHVDARSEGLSDSMVFGVIAFGEVADQLRLHGRLDQIAVTGTLQRQEYNGELRFSVLADGIESARTSRERARQRMSDAQRSED
jgi:single-strand DNA-binding protein